MPESTLTPAPVMVATLPSARKAAIRSAAALLLMVFVDRAVEMTAGMVGTERRIGFNEVVLSSSVRKPVSLFGVLLPRRLLYPRDQTPCTASLSLQVP